MSRVESHYDSSPEHEWDRLGKKNPIEFVITMLALSEYLPQPPAGILDIGGGPGRYTIALTQRGYSVTLLDLSRGNLEFARAKANEANVQLDDYIHGAKELPWLILTEQEQYVMATGVYKPAPDGGFIDAYFAHHREIKPLMERCALQTLDLVSCEGVISMIDEKVNALSGEAWEAWVHLNYTWAKDPAVHGMAEHLLYVGRKP